MNSSAGGENAMRYRPDNTFNGGGGRGRTERGGKSKEGRSRLQ